MRHGSAASTFAFHDGLDSEGGRRTLAGSPDQWSVRTESRALQVDTPDDDAGAYLAGPPVPALDGAYRIRTWVKIAEPARGLATSSVDLLFNTEDLDNSYLARFRVRNGVRYFTLVKRVDSVSEQLVDDILAYDFDWWLEVEIAFEAGRFDVRVDGRPVASCAEFDRLTGGAVGIGASGATALFDSVEVIGLGNDDRALEPASETAAPPRRGGELARTVCGAIENEAYRVEFVKVTQEEGVSFLAEVLVRHDGGWRQVDVDERWVVLRGDGGSRRNLYASTANHWVTFTEYEWIDRHKVRLRASDPRHFELTVTWSLTGQDPRVSMLLVPKTAGYYVIGYQAFAGRALEQVDEVLCGPLQHARMVRGAESIGCAELTAPVSLVQYTDHGEPLTVGLYVPAGELRFEYEPSKGDDEQRFGMSLRNDRGEVQPILYAPQYGQHAVLEPGTEYRFEVGLYARRTELFEAYRQLVRRAYDYRTYRRNVFGASLTDTMHNLIDLLKAGPVEDDTVEYRPSPSGWWNRAKGFIDIENDQAVRATTTSVLLSAYYLTADDELYEQRARPSIEYHVSRNGYGWTPRHDRTVYGDPTKNKVCAVPFGAAALAPLHSMMRGRMPVVRRLALDQLDTEDYWLKRTPMSSPLAAYRMTGDPALLRQAEELAREYIAREVDTAYTENVDPHDFQNYYSKAWVELLEMYEETADKTYLEAAYREAKRYVTQVFVRPVPTGTMTVPGRPLFIDRQIELTGWWDPADLFEYPKTDVPDEKVPNWVVSPNGMSFEALKTYRFNGFTMNPAWAPFLLRLAAHVGDDLLRDIAHNAVVGRYTNYPGYYYRQFSVNHMKPQFPYEGPFGNSTIYYHHAPAQLGLTIDYLLTEHQTRSDGNITFPSEFEQNYVWFAYRVYGHRPGRFYGHDGAWLWMPRGLVATSNEQVNWIAAEGGDRLFVSLTNESDTTERVRLRVNSELVPMRPGRAYRVTVVQDNRPPEEAWMTDHALDTTVSAHGITAVIVHAVGPIKIPLHTAPDPPGPSAGSYHLDDDTPVGAVWGMVLVKPDNSRYDAYVQAATDRLATLCYSTDGGATFQRIDRAVYPNEWSVPVHDLSKTFTYYVEADGRRTEPVELICPST